MNKSNKLRHVCGVIVALLCAGMVAQASETIAIGPVEALSPKGSFVTVLGQTFALGGRQSSIYRSLTAGDSVAVGSYVLAKGEATSDGRLIAKSIERLDSPYVPGSTAVYLRGTVDAFDASLGVLTIGSVEFFVSQALSNDVQSIEVGKPVEVVGIQALAAGPVWANAIVGTGKQVQAIVGTGKQAQAIVGTGKQAQAIVGTGAATQAIVGTGKQTQAIVGTGKQTQAIVGTGKQTQAIVGTGAATQAIVGTGKQTQAIVGTGKQTQAIVGTGAATQAIVGTGVSTKAIVGTGKQTRAIVGTGY